MTDYDKIRNKINEHISNIVANKPVNPDDVELVQNADGTCTRIEKIGDKTNYLYNWSREEE